MIPARMLMLLGAVLLPLAAAAAPHPDPSLGPTEVVRIQLEAMAHNDRPRPDAGLALVFDFASPGNRAQTGPLQRFSAMVHSGYAQLLNHRSARLSPPVIEGDQALQGVELVDRDGVTVRFVFILSRQSDPPYAGCWMTDSVLRQQSQEQQAL